MNLDLILEISKKEQKNLYERFIKLSEECGELAQEILIKNRAFGLRHKTPGADGIKGECVDILLTVLSIYFLDGGDMQELDDLVQKKCQKWQSVQEK